MDPDRYLYADAPRLPEGDNVDPRPLVGAGEAGVELEIGPGRGGFLLERLNAEPAARMVGLEIRLKWATLVDRKLRSAGFGDRARVFAEDARAALRRFPDACVGRAFVHFPDPWWKKRHHKRLIAQPDVVAELGRVVRSDGELFVQTDVLERAQAYEHLLSESAVFSPFGAEARVADNPFGARSPREHRAIADGLPIYRLHYRRRDS